MPYHIEKKGGNTPFCVVKGKSGDSGGVVKCHKTRPQAEAHMRALYANTKDEHSVDVDFDVEQELEELRQSMRGSRVRLYFQEGEKTADLRVIDPNATNFNRPPPLALRLQTRQPESGGHAGAEVCGVIDSVYRDGTVIVAEARLDMNSAAGVEAERLIRERIMQTWSPDLGDATIDIEENVEDEDGHTPQEVLAHFVKATFLGATLVAMPALASAVVELLTDDGTVLVEAPKREVLVQDPVGHSTDPEEHKVIVDRIAACAGPSDPPAEFFTDPKLDGPQRYITITSEGRIFGHLACWGECHIGYPRVCVELTPGQSYNYFHIGQVKTAEGTLIATGPLALKGGHAARDWTVERSQAHYDDTDSAFADVVMGEDEFGIWFSGAIRSTATVEQVRTARASGFSGDWRRIEDNLELIGACAVNVPGFPKVRMVASSEEEDPIITVLVAAGGAPIGVESDDCGCEDCEPDPVAALHERLDFLEVALISQLESDFS